MTDDVKKHESQVKTREIRPDGKRKDSYGGRLVDEVGFKPFEKQLKKQSKRL
jgi:hypothetical protein